MFSLLVVMQDDFVLEEFLAVEAKWFEASHITSFTAHHSYKLNYTAHTQLYSTNSVIQHKHHFIEFKVNSTSKIKSKISKATLSPTTSF